MAYGQNMNAPMAGMTGLAALKGRQGDNTLVHVNPMELKALDNMAPGGLTRNPYTGLPEAFKLKDILPALGAIAGGVFLAPMLGPMLGLGAAGSAAVGSGLGAAGGTAAAGGNREEILGSGLMSGATAGLGSYLSGAGKAAAATTADQTVGQNLLEKGISPSANIPPEVLSSPASMMSPEQINVLGSGAGTATTLAKAAAPLPTTLERIGGLGGAAATGLAAMAPIGPEMPKEEPVGPAVGQEFKAEQTASREDIDKYIRQGGVMPRFFNKGFVQAEEGGQIATAPMFSGMVEGRGDGMSDEVPFEVVGDPEIDTAMLSPDEYVMDAYTVAALGNGSSDAGAEKLDAFRKELRNKVYGKKEQPKEIDGAKELSKLA